FDVNFENPYDRTEYSNLFNNLRFAPLPWMSFNVNSQVPAFAKGFTEVNTWATVQPVANVQLNVGHRYLSSNLFFEKSSLFVTGACFADVGHNVICVDNDAQKIKQLQAGEVPIYEPGLEEIIHRNVSARRLRFTGSIQEGVDNSQIIFIAVPTPQQPDGDVDLSFLEKVAREIAGVLRDYRVIVDKSTVPVKTGEKVAES